MRQCSRIKFSFPRIPICLAFLLVFSCVIDTRQEETRHPDSFSSLLQIVDDGSVARERRNADASNSHDFLADEPEGSVPVTEGPSIICIKKTFRLRTPSQLSVDVCSTVYAVTGSDISVTCRASSTSGKPKIEWFRYGYPVTNRYSADVAAFDGVLRIRRVSRFNEGSYTCKASNEEGKSEEYFTLKRLNPSLPIILTSDGHVSFGPNDKVAEITIGSDATVYRGATLTIRCPVEGPGNPVVYWTNQGRSVSIGKAQEVGNDLVIRNIDNRYALVYTCTARTLRGKVEEESTVTVLALDPPRIKRGTRNLRLVEEDSTEVEIYVGTNLTIISETQVTVRCEAPVNPAPDIKWKIQGRDTGFKDTVTLSKDNSTLTISDTTDRDSGLYSCTASNNVGRDLSSSSINILPPQPPRIHYSNQVVTQLKKRQVLEATIGDELTVLTGVNVAITCPTSGLPFPTIQWRKDDNDLSFNGTTLKIKNVTTQDSGVFTCEATNRAGKISHGSEFRVIAAERPEIKSSAGRLIGLEGIEEAVVRIGQDLRVVEGVIVRLLCRVNRGFPTPQVTWYLNDRLIMPSERFLINTRPIDSLTVNGIQLQDTGQVSCVAVNTAGQARESSFIRILGESSAQIVPGNKSVESIEGTAKVAIQIGDSLNILSGSDISIDCIASGTPPPALKWRWNGREVISRSRTKKFNITEITDGSRLSIQQLTSENEGQYECVATNTGGADRIASVITVLDGTLPKIEASSTSVEHITNLSPVSVQIGTRVTVLSGVRLEITCTASGIPEPSIFWLRQGKQIDFSERFSVHNGTLVVRAIRRSDEGSFTCTANNTIGKTATSTQVDVLEPIKPRITQTGRNLTIERITRLSEAVGGNILCRDGIDLELTCTVQGRPTPQIFWLRGSKTVGSGFKLDLGILEEESSGDYTCLATNVGGEDRKTTRLNVISAIPPKIQSSDKTIEAFEEGAALVVPIGTQLRVAQGTKIDFICRVSGFPTPTVSWAVGNQVLNDRLERQGYFVSPYNGTSSTLLVRTSRSSANDEVFSCRAYNGGGSKTVFSKVRFFERVKPSIKSTWVTGSVGVKESLVTRDPFKVTVGDDVRTFTKTKFTIECPVFAIPLAKVQWTFNEGLLQSKHQTVNNDLVLSEESDLSDAGRYGCSASNPLGNDRAWSNVFFLEPRAPTITTSESSVRLLTTVEYTTTIGANITTLVGSNITFVCASEGLPNPTVSWQKDGVALNASSTLYRMFAFDKNATGVYSCVAENLGGSVMANSTVIILDREIESATVPRIIASGTNQVVVDGRKIVQHTIGGNVTILEGRDLLLRCPTEGFPVPSISWLFNGLPVQISDTLQIDDTTGNLKVVEMTPEDDGVYTCVATNIAGEAREASFTTVVEPTFPIIDSSNVSVEVFDPTRKVLKVKIGTKVTTLTGTPVGITCDVTGFPKPSVRWIKDSTTITESDSERLLMSNNKINLLRAQKSDSGLYMCTASSPGGQTAVVSNITFVEPVKPKIFPASEETELLRRLSVNITIGEKLTVLDKSNVTIECLAEGIPHPSLSWSNDGKKVENSGRNFLHLRSVTKEDSGRYTCSADNFLGSDRQSAILTVRVGRKPTIKSKIDDVRISDKVTAIELDIGSNLTLVGGSSVSIFCKVEGVPDPAITWLLNGNQMFDFSNKTVLMVKNPDLLNLQTVSCSAVNFLGAEIQESYFTILEPSKPVVQIIDDPKNIEAQDLSPVTLTTGDNVTALTNTSITIQCPTTGIPKPTVTWTKDGQQILTGGRYTIQDDGSLMISEADKEDTARYTCIADSVAGKDSASSVVQVVEPEQPAVQVPESGVEIPVGDGGPVTMNIGDNVTAASNTTITIKCPVSGVPTPSVTWTKNGVDIDSVKALSITADNSLVLKGTKIEDGGKYTCSAQSKFGKDDISSVVRIIEPSKPIIDISEKPKAIEAQDRSPITLNIGDNVTALTNTSITIQCPTSGVPKPTVTWTKDGQDLPSGSRYIVQDDSSLLIIGADKVDNARYTCTAESLVGKDVASSTLVVVEPAKPMIQVSEPGREIPVGDGSPVTINIGDNVTAASNTTITIKCTATGVPTPSVTWTKDGVKIVPGDEFYVTYEGSLVLKETDLDDSAEYTCVVKSKFGKDDTSSVVKIKEPTKPEVIIPGKPRTIEALDRSPITLTIGDNVTALTNTSITIQCPTTGVPKPTVTWTKDGEKLLIGGKYTVQDDSSLVISKTDEDDNARYTCNAESVTGKDSTSSVVKVVAPIKPEINVPESGRDIPVGDGSPVTMNIGDNVTAASNTTITIRCPVSGVPTPSVTWTKDGQNILESDNVFIRSDNSLVIKRAEIEDSAKFICSVHSQFGRKNISSKVTIVGHSKPVLKTPKEPKAIESKDRSPVSISIGDNVTTFANTSITITCPTTGIPKPVVTWTKDGREISVGERYTVQKDGSLLISEANEEDDARYTCTADSVAGKDSATSVVKVVEPSKPAINVPEPGVAIPVGDGSPITMNIGDNVTAAANTTITIRCPVSGVPTPSITWTKDGVDVIEGEKLSIMKDDALIIKGADSEDSAKYTCKVESHFGEESLSSMVKIKGPSKPVIKISDKSTSVLAQDLTPLTLIAGDNVTALTNTSITIQCPTSGIPKPTVTWTKNGQEILIGGRYKVKDDGSLLISEADEVDNARYTCTAGSVSGKDSASSTVKVVDPVRPAIEVPKSGSEIPVGDGGPVTANIGDNVTAALNTTITIKCPVSGVPTPSVSWFKDGSPISQGERLSLTSNSSLVVNRAEMGDSAKYTCSVQSVFGKEDLSTTMTIIEPVAPQIIHSVGNITSVTEGTVNITIGQNLLTVIDTKLSINCTVKGIPIPHVTWTKGNQTLPSDGRMTLRNGTLVIVELETSDSGNYTCSSKNSAGMAASSSNVNVKVPSLPEIIRTGVKDVQVYDSRSIEVVAGSKVVTISGNNVILSCPVQGFPTPSIQWRKGDVLLGEEESTLTLLDTEVNDSGQYTCTATSSLVEFYDSATTNLTVIALQAPVISTDEQTVDVLKIERVSVTVGGVVTTLDGNGVTILCQVSGFPKPQIRWLKDGEVVQGGGDSYNVEAAVADNGSNYSCIASNIAGKAKATTQINILAGQAPKIESSRQNIVHMAIDFLAITVGSNVTTLADSGLEISCPTTGFPKPFIQWYRHGNPVQPGMMLTVDQETGSLFILSISYRKGGMFTCEASNALGSDRASSLVAVRVPQQPQITVSHKAVSNLDNREPVTLTIGQKLTVLSRTKILIKCLVTGLPKPVIAWNREENQLETSGNKLLNDSVLIIKNITGQDSGLYLCTASNLAGKVSAGSLVYVTETSPPRIAAVHQELELPQGGSFSVDAGTNVTTVAGNSLSIRCNATGFPVPQITWSKDGTSLSAKGPVYVLPTLKPSDSGQYQCIATNVDGVDTQDIRIHVLDGTAPNISSPKQNILSVSGEDEVTIVVGGNITTVVGTAVKILCPVIALPSATIGWLFNGSSVKDRSVRLVDSENASLTMTSVTPEDVGSYTCVAKNAYGSSSETTYLSLIIPAEPKILSSNNHINDYKSTKHDLVIGDNLETLVDTIVYIRCQASGKPSPVISWKKSGVLVQSSSRLKIVNNTLILLDSTKSDTGNYTCAATNGIGFEEKATFLKFISPEKPLIRGEPFDIESFDGQSVTVAVGGTLKVLQKTTVNIRCVASGKPVPSVFWNSTGDMQPANKYDIKQEGTLLTIREVDTRDSGKYMCNAVNKAGKDSQAAVLEVVEAELPIITTSNATVSWYDKEPRVLPVGGSVQVLSGTMLTLTCEHSAFPQATVEWTVLDEEGQDSGQDAGYEVVNGSLVLMSLQPTDTARYVCSVRNVAGSASATTALKVVDPQPPDISSSEENIVMLSGIVSVQATVGGSVTVLPGSYITITCSADGVPNPTVTWSRGDKPLRTTSSVNNTAMQFVMLSIEDATVADTGEYLCTARSEVGTDRESTKVTVIDPTKPIIKKSSLDTIPLSNKTKVDVPVGSDITVLSYTRVNITCQASGIPTPKITWLRNGVPIKSYDNSSLVLSISDRDDAGQVTCIAENLAGNATQSTKIDVIEPILPRIKSGEGEIVALNMRRSVRASVGTSVETFTRTTLTLTCSVEGTPQPSVSWNKNGESLKSKDRVSISSDGTLVIKNTLVTDTGRYMCLATSLVGETYQVSSVVVRAPIRPRIRRSRSYIIWYERQPFRGKVGDNLTTLKGRKLTLTCPAFGLPQPAISWYRGGMRMRSGGNYVAIGNTLIMFNLDPMDTDRYTCVARNFAGVTSATSTLKVHDPMPPKIMPSYGYEESLQNFDRLNITIGKEASLLRGSPLTIKCPVLGVPEPKIKWIKDRKMLVSNDRMDMHCTGVLNIFKVELEDSGDYACIAESFLGMDIAFSAVTVYEAIRPSVEISGRVYVSGGNLVDMHVGDNLTAILTTPININCSARGIPKPRMRWQMNGRQLGNGGNYKTDGNGALVIKGLEDPGQFTCIAENFVGQDGASSFIRILDPTRPAIITPENPMMIKARDRTPLTITVGNNVTALTVTKITIQCLTSGEPKPNVTWSKDGQKIPEGSKYAVRKDGSLLIREAGKHDSGLYTCTSENIVGNDSASTVIQVVEPVKPSINAPKFSRDIPLGDGSPVTMDIGDNVTASSNTTITIKCSVSGVPTPSVTWTRDGLKIVPGLKYSFTSDESLVIEGPETVDSGEYTCSAKSFLGTKSKTSTVKYLAPSKPVVKASGDPKTIEAQDRSPVTLPIGDNVTALSNTSVTIECPTTGVPKPIVTWTKNGQKISSGGRYLVQDDGSLQITEADEDDNARYTCSADNVAGKDSASSNVKIVEPVKPSIEVPEYGKEISAIDGSPVTINIGDNVTATSNTTITIKCPISGVPSPSVSWTKDGEDVVPGAEYSVNSDNGLVIKGTGAINSAEYTCSVKSVSGTDSETSSVIIIGPSKPRVKASGEPKTIETQDRSPISFTVGDNVTVLTNTSVTILCPTTGVPKPTVTWTKDGQEILSGDKYTMQVNGSLLINEVDEKDSAQYTCTADSAAGKDSATSTVQVVEPTKPTIDVPEFGNEIPFRDGSPVVMNIGDNVTAASNTTITIKCPVSGVPTPFVTWTKDGAEISDENGYSITSDNSLGFAKAASGDSGSYSCNAQSFFGNDSASSTVRIIEPSKPVVQISDHQNTIEAEDLSPLTLTIGDNVTALVNTSITIQCPTSGVPKPSVTWTKDGQELLSGGRYRVQNNGSLVITDASEEDNARYTCTADSVTGKDSAASIVQVESPKKPTILVQRPGPKVPIGDGRPVVSPVGSQITELAFVKITLSCPTDGSPRPKITWKKDGVELVPGERYVVDDKGSLTITSALTDDSGTFTCTAKNIAGAEEVSSSIDILEPLKPVIEPSKDSVVSDDHRNVTAGVGSKVNAFKGATISLTCAVKGIPKPDVNWTKDGQSLLLGERLVVSSNGTLIIRDSSVNDSGNYTCTAKSRSGQDAATSSVTVAGDLEETTIIKLTTH